MSESDDKNRASAADSGSKSLFDSGWDALLGDAGGPASPPSFAPPKPAGPAVAPPKPAEPEADAGEPDPASSEPEESDAAAEPDASEASDAAEPDAPALREADSVPRNSAAQASVSGAFVAPKPRPDPETPPPYERPEGVSPYYDDPDNPWGDPDAITGEYVAPMIEPALSAVASEIEAALNARADADAEADAPADAQTEPAAAKVIELPSARARGDDDDDDDDDAAEDEAAASASMSVADPEDPSGGGSRGPLMVVGVLVGVALIAFAASKLGGGDDPGPADTSAPAAAEADSPEPGPKPSPEPSPKPDPSPDPASVAGGTETGGDETSDEELGGTETGGDETGGWQPKPQRANVDPRDPSLIPPGTPEDNAKAFTKLPVSIHDGPPVGGIGASGIHIDAVSTSRGRENTECDNPTASFSLAVAKYVNVCFRVVHPREPETLRVIWEKDGKVTRRGKVRIPDLHAYTTRAYLFLRPEYIGDWKVRIVPEGEESIDLAVAEFVITE